MATMTDDNTKIADIHLRFETEEHNLLKREIKEKEIYNVESLMSWIEKKFDLPCDIELFDNNNKMFTVFSDLFPPDSHSPIELRILLKHIRNVNTNDKPIKSLPYLTFFTQRGIDMKYGLYLDAAFSPCLEALKCEVKLEKSAIQNFKRAMFNKLHENELSKGQLIGKILELAVEYDPFLKTKEECYITLPKHQVKPDHTIIRLFSGRKIIVVEDKHEIKNFEEGLVQALDQARTYSFTEEGKKFPFVYGITTNLNQWRFFCYRPPKPNTPTTYYNFYLSHIFQFLTVDFDVTNPISLNELKTIEQKLEPLIGFIRGLCRLNADIIVAEKLKLKLDEEFLNLQAEELQKEQLYEQQHKTDLELFGFDLDARKKLKIELK